MSRRKQANPKSFKEGSSESQENSEKSIIESMVLIEKQSSKDFLHQNQGELKDTSDEKSLSEKASSSCGDNDDKTKSENSDTDYIKEKNHDDEIDVETYSESSEDLPESSKEDCDSHDRTTRSPGIENTFSDNQTDVPSISFKKMKLDERSNKEPIIINGKKLYPLERFLKSEQDEVDEDEINETYENNSETQKVEVSELNNTNESNVNHENQNSDQANLLKTTVYQCNSCAFTTDKKFIMNKHSRIHLPQKRKAMEELNSCNEDVKIRRIDFKALKQEDPSSEPTITLTRESTENSQSQKFYCEECDIHLSSVSSYMHHKNFYCQKYKTIEAVVPKNTILPSTSTKTEPEKRLSNPTLQRPKQESINTEEKSSNNLKFQPNNNQESNENHHLKIDSQVHVTKMPNFPATISTELKHNIAKLASNENEFKYPVKGFTPEALNLKYPIGKEEFNRSPDFVYVPVYLPNPSLKPTANVSATRFVQNFPIPPYAFRQQMSLNKDSIAFVPNFNIKPMDLRVASVTENITNEKENGKSDAPLDLSVKSKAVSFNKPNFTNNFMQNNGLSSFITEKKMMNLCHICNLDLENPLNLIVHQNFGCLNDENREKYLKVYNSFDKFKLIPSNPIVKQEQNIEDKMILYCKNCRRSFDSIKQFQIHNCTEYKPQNISPFPYSISIAEKMIAAKKINESIEAAQKAQFQSMSENESRSNVNETISQNDVESYAKKSNSVSPQKKQFFICSTCGYRGNTLRGVKQHGKLHLSNNEPFGIIDTTGTSLNISQISSKLLAQKNSAENSFESENSHFETKNSSFECSENSIHNDWFKKSFKNAHQTHFGQH